jgi:hypothetical protein
MNRSSSGRKFLTGFRNSPGEQRADGGWAGDVVGKSLDDAPPSAVEGVAHSHLGEVDLLVLGYHQVEDDGHAHAPPAGRRCPMSAAAFAVATSPGPARTSPVFVASQLTRYSVSFCSDSFTKKISLFQCSSLLKENVTTL